MCERGITQSCTGRLVRYYFVRTLIMNHRTSNIANFPAPCYACAVPSWFIIKLTSGRLILLTILIPLSCSNSCSTIMLSKLIIFSIFLTVVLLRVSFSLHNAPTGTDSSGKLLIIKMYLQNIKCNILKSNNND
jgi:hypothetical protein